MGFAHTVMRTIWLLYEKYNDFEALYIYTYWPRLAYAGDFRACCIYALR